jgi:hypothetical protein
VPPGIWKILYFVPVGLAVVAVVCSELVVYVRMTRWYFHWGPIAIGQRWQTRVGVQEAVAAVEKALEHSWLVWKKYDRSFAVRRPVWEPSTYPRICLRVEEDRNGAVVVYEVRPFVTMAPLVLMALLPPTTWYIAFANWFVPAYVVVGYTYFYLRESRRLRELDRVREALGEIGVRICPSCGYDLFGQVDGGVCPECGAAARTNPAPVKS